MHRKSAMQLRRDFLNGTLSAKEIASYFLNRIKVHNPKLNAFLHIHEEKALKRAEVLDEKRAKKEPLGHLAANRYQTFW